MGDQRHRLFLIILAVPMLLASLTEAADIFLTWDVAFNWTIKPVSNNQPVITINGMFPGPLINSTTNDNVYVNVFNHLDEPLLITWLFRDVRRSRGDINTESDEELDEKHVETAAGQIWIAAKRAWFGCKPAIEVKMNGIQQRLNSWQDGVSGTNCPILPRTNWTYAFQVKDQIGSFFYFPSINFQKAAGGYGPIRVNNRNVILVPFAKPEAEFDLLIGDWHSISYQDARRLVGDVNASLFLPSHVLINGKPAYGNSFGGIYESIEVQPGKTYRLRISNVGTKLSLNFRIQNHTMTLVETEGSYTNQIELASLDVHIGQSYSVLFTANQQESSYYIVATPTQTDTSSIPTLNGVAVLKYSSSNSDGPIGSLPSGPAPLDREFSIDQARSIRWNLTTGAARPNPQGTFNITNVSISQTFILHLSNAIINNSLHFTVNNVSYITPSTPLKLADLFFNGSGVYTLDEFPVDSISDNAVVGTFVATGIHKGWAEFVFQNDLDEMDSWHLDGFGFYVLGFGDGEWNSTARDSYNLYNPVVRSTAQVYPGGWTAVYAFLDNPGMWNLRSQRLQNWYLGQELYVRVFDPDPNPAKERRPPTNLIRCGLVAGDAPVPGALP